jgi:hypothetical protein
VEKRILDATCGGRTIWTPENKDREDTLYIDERKKEDGFAGQEGRNYGIHPDELADFTDLDYPDESFKLVVFDPPHVIKEGGEPAGYVEKNYGVLDEENWKETIAEGFRELWRVLESEGVLVFKFADNDAYWSHVTELFPVEPLFGTTTKQRSNMETRWFVFFKAKNFEKTSGDFQDG